ncbi:uncharacterized protein A1O9_07340 [Exophiala aquamarina CBS 119918]|uniref:Thioesterase domain-containing protein n=1 Tax=Exophiala aquamarina CBS 119918 TaxID=1182545 RepID=A0A072PNQ4_9EURO|nr:uncharacterized protein A1O9_07340 [Exophiala aquamarina CBS 119918]KEF57150.1 hypothetical protein A1O9_07340 [Exophiala aquamarina CBS 119918]
MGTEESLFRRIPWCLSTLSDSGFAIEPTLTRTLDPTTGENALLARTLNNHDTIEGWCSLYRRPALSARNAKDECRTLLALRAGLDGYPGVCHGGITATVLDEIMSILVAVCRESQGLAPDNLTADLRVRYLRPVPTPLVVLVTAKIRDIQKDKKYFVDAELVDENGVVLAKGEGLFIHKSVERL